MIIEYKETDFSNPRQKADFIEKSVQKTIEQVPVVGDAAEVIINDSKQDDGLTNLKNKRMSNSFKGSYNYRDEWLQQYGAQNRQSQQTKDNK